MTLPTFLEKIGYSVDIARGEISEADTKIVVGTLAQSPAVNLTYNPDQLSQVEATLRCRDVLDINKVDYMESPKKEEMCKQLLAIKNKAHSLAAKVLNVPSISSEH